MMQQWWPDTDSQSEFLSPSVIVSGRGSLSRAATVLAETLGITSGRVLVAADDVVVANGLTGPLLAALEEAGFEVILRGGFGSEPSSEVIDDAARDARRAGVRAVIGIGGGSVLDSSKLLALLVRNEGSTRDWMGLVPTGSPMLPILLIPTTCGTGSEATRIAMVTVEGAKRASSYAGYVPDAVILDPDLVATLPGPVVAATAMDALAHAVESLMSTARSPMSTHHALASIGLLVGNIEKAAQGDQSARSACLWGSHLAGQALNAGVVMGHSLAYALAYAHPMPHGTSCALALPYCIAYNHSMQPELAAALASALTSGTSTDLSAAAEAMLQLVRRLGLPATLDDIDIPADSISLIARRVISEYPRPTNPVPMDAASLERLLDAMRNGDLAAAFAAPLAEAVQ